MNPTHSPTNDTTLATPTDVELGILAITNGIAAWIESDPTSERRRWTGHCLLERHRRGDWGDLDPEDTAINNAAVADGGRLLSAYTHPADDTTIWIITEADRAHTTILHPSEY